MIRTEVEGTRRLDSVGVLC